MAPPSATRSLRFALHEEFLKLYAVTFLGFVVISEAPQAFYLVEHAGIRDLVVLLFVFLGVLLMASGIVGVFYRLQNSQAAG